VLELSVGADVKDGSWTILGGVLITSVGANVEVGS